MLVAFKPVHLCSSMQRNADAVAFEQVMNFGFGVQVFMLNKSTAVPSFIGRWCALLGV